VGADRQRRDADQSQQDRRYAPLHFDLYVGAVRRRLAAQAGLAGERLERRGAGLFGVEREPPLVECLQVERLAAGERGVVGQGDELAADDEGVADVDAT
jgi:hypothetical protein